MNGCTTCEREGHRPHKNGAANRCPEAKAKAVITQLRWAGAHRLQVREMNRLPNLRYARSLKGWERDRRYALKKIKERIEQQLRDLDREEAELTCRKS